MSAEYTPTENAIRAIQAEAWDEGARAMMRAVSENQSVSFIAPHNPYRAIEKHLTEEGA